MDLKIYDGMCVRIIDSIGNTFDGICCHNSVEYDEHEYGRDEESLQIEHFLFFESDIKDIQRLDENDGPYGRFLDPYGKIEILTVDDGIDSIEDILFSDENEHVMRLLCCLEDYLNPALALTLPDQDEVIVALRKLLKVNHDPTIQDKIWHILNNQNS